MPARKDKKTLDEWRAYNYAVNYDLRGQFKAMPEEIQQQYQMLIYALPEWKLNRFGAPAMTYELENDMIRLAFVHRLPDAFFLISFYTSEEGWQEYVRQFNELEQDESFPREKYEKKEADFLHRPCG